MDEIVSLISTVGFPIVMCLILMWYVHSKDEKHIEESRGFAESLEKNTAIIQKLYDFLTMKGGE